MIIIKSNEMVEGGEIMARINVDDNENLEKAIKRFKRMIEKEGIIREYKKREYYEKPSTIQNRKNKTLQRKLSKKIRETYDAGKSGY
jgi:small subunit ribosomal protein S21